MSERQIYAVSELAELLRGLLEDSLPRLWVQGEISNFSKPASGHWYFTLKDGQAQIRCAMFKPRNFGIKPPRDGDVVLVRGAVTLYAARGDLQLLCEHLEPAGEGALLAAIEQRKKKLAAEGLFDLARKRALPAWPLHIGLVTSATGAAVQDIRSTLARRWPLATVWLAPVVVQGSEAPAAIVKALRELPSLAPLDLLILARGGGSLEDLMAFNEEAVVRAVAACSVPVVTGVGHEVDTSLVDYAADLRAATPTAAAERATPDIADWRERVAGLAELLLAAIEDRLESGGEKTAQLTTRLRASHPGRRLHERQQRLDELGERLAHIASTLTRRAAERLHLLINRLQEAPARRTAPLSARLESLSAQLAAYNPEAVLARGYAIAYTGDGGIATDAAQLPDGTAFQLWLARGTVAAIAGATAARRARKKPPQAPLPF